MSWHYLPELVEESSEAIFSDGKRSAPWKRNRIAERCSSDGKETACFPCFQSGTTAAPSTDDPGVASWMSSLRDSHASPSVSLESRERRTTAATDGLQPFVFLGKCSQGLPFWKTSQGCLPLLMDTLDRYSETWPRSGLMQSGTASLLQPSEPLTRGTGSGFLATPTATANQLAPSMQKHPGCRKLYPTPLASDGEKAATDSLARLIETGHRRGRLDGFTREGEEINRYIPTPNANDWKGSYQEGQRRGQLTDPAMGLIETGGHLNPMWVEWLMAWPIGWTGLGAVEMDRWRQWCRSFGMNLKERRNCE